jgi:hypothetical protein
MLANWDVKFSGRASVTTAMEAKMPLIMAAIGTEYANKVKLLMRDSPASGRVYGKHRASAPGEPPAPDTGALLGSVTWRVAKKGRAWRAEVGSNLKYAVYLEYGAARGVRGKGGRIEAVQWILYPRPAWGPALREMRPIIEGFFTSPTSEASQ